MEEESRTQAGSSHSALPPWVPAGHPPAGGPNLHLGNPRPHFLGTRSLYTPSYRSLSKKVSYFNQVGTHCITQPPSKFAQTCPNSGGPGSFPGCRLFLGQKGPESPVLFLPRTTLRPKEKEQGFHHISPVPCPGSPEQILTVGLRAEGSQFWLK